MATILIVGGLAALTVGVFMMAPALMIAGGVSTLTGGILSFGIFSLRENDNSKDFGINRSPVMMRSKNI
jgi:hypothetical protein